MAAQSPHLGADYDLPRAELAFRDGVPFAAAFDDGYYNSDDESRYPTMLVAAIGNSTFPALSNPDLVVPSACKIISDDLDSDFWNANETIILAENGIDFCNGKCILVIDIKYETITVEMDVYEIEIGQ